MKKINVLSKIKMWLKTDTGILLALLFVFPLGLFLLWKYKKQSQIEKSISTVGIVLFQSLFLGIVLGFTVLISGYNQLEVDARQLETEHGKLIPLYNELVNTEQEFVAYKEKMKPYESLSEADAKKRENNANAANKVDTAFKELPNVSEVTLEDKDSVNSAKKLYDSLTTEQKDLVDSTIITQLIEKIDALETKEKEEAERKAQEEKKRKEAEQKKKEEEARGYETGTTYNQLARTPDDYIFTKVKFYGKVIQVMEGEDTTQIRLAVNDDYDTVIYGEYDSSMLSSRVLDDDYITIYGISTGLLSYQSTMGGTITIPSMTIDKIDQ